MNTIEPGTWVILEFTGRTNLKTYKIFSGWYGGFARGDTWKLSSGIESFVDKGQYYDSLQDSRTKYLLPKTSERMSAYQMGLLHAWAQELCEESIRVRTITSNEFMKIMNGISKIDYE